MKTKWNTIYEELLKVIRWFAGFFEDQKGNSSSKRAIAYIALYMLSDLVVTSMQLNITISPYILTAYVVIELVALGVIGNEFFLKNGIPGLPNVDRKPVEETSTKVETTESNNPK